MNSGDPRVVQQIDAYFDGASYQAWPATDAPYKIRGKIETTKSVRLITIPMTREEAETCVQHLCGFLGITVTGISTGKS